MGKANRIVGVVVVIICMNTSNSLRAGNMNFLGLDHEEMLRSVSSRNEIWQAALLTDFQRSSDSTFWPILSSRKHISPARQRSPTFLSISAHVFQQAFSESVGWPSGSDNTAANIPDLIPQDVFLCVFIKSYVFIPLLPANVVGLRPRIIGAVSEATQGFLCDTWEEIY